MSTRYITADWIYPVSSPRIREGVLIIDGEKITGITDRASVDADNLELYTGILVPGFVNTHCHIELSHLQNRISTGTGLLHFIEHVVKLRETNAEAIAIAIQQADAYMWAHGIQAVGDICNTTDSFLQKSKSNIRYHNFVEVFDFMQTHQSDRFISGNLQVFENAAAPKSLVPHAPYSVSPALFKKVIELNQDHHTISIHNQETQAEDDLFRYGKGAFYAFYEQFGFSLKDFNAFHDASIRYAMQHMDPSVRTLFVHNTMTSAEDIQAAQEWNANTFWCTCPNANLYIENRLPDYQKFIAAEARMTIGTDSLTSNWQLCIFEEMKTMLRFQSGLSFETLLTWATLNGAMALGMDSLLGSFDAGKTPGVIWLPYNPDTDNLGHSSIAPRRLV